MHGARLQTLDAQAQSRPAAKLQIPLEKLQRVLPHKGSESSVREDCKRAPDALKMLAAVFITFMPEAASFNPTGPAANFLMRGFASTSWKEEVRLKRPGHGLPAFDAKLADKGVASRTGTWIGSNIQPEVSNERRSLKPCIRMKSMLDVSRQPHQTSSEQQAAKKPGFVGWSFIDAVYLITCPCPDGTNPRLEAAWKQLEAIGLDSKTEVCEFSPDNEDRVRGCYMSHISVLESAEARFGLRDSSKDCNILVLEDNLSISPRIAQKTLDSVADFSSSSRLQQAGVGHWDMVHLAYNMYVPGLSVQRLSEEEHIVRLRCNEDSALGTTAYIMSRSGVNRLLAEHRRIGYVPGGAIPNLMARLFPDSRYAAFPMPLHRAANIKSLVNSQLDALRSLIFLPEVYTMWERALVGTGLSTNVLFPALCIALLVGAVAGWEEAVSSILAALRGEAASLTSEFASAPQDVWVALAAFRLSLSAGCLVILGYGLALAPRPETVDWSANQDVASIDVAQNRSPE